MSSEFTFNKMKPRDYVVALSGDEGTKVGYPYKVVSIWRDQYDGVGITVELPDGCGAGLNEGEYTPLHIRTEPKVKPLDSQTGLYEGDRILIEGNWGVQNICEVERFRDCLGFFMSDAHRKAGRFTPLSEMYGYGTGSETGYIGNFGEYIKNPVALWVQVQKDTPLTNEW